MYLYTFHYGTLLVPVLYLITVPPFMSARMNHFDWCHKRSFWRALLAALASTLWVRSELHIWLVPLWAWQVYSMYYSLTPII